MTLVISRPKLFNAKIPFMVVVKDYLELCKIKVVALLVLTAWVGLALAPDLLVPRSFLAQFFTLLGIGLLSSSAAVINHLVDREIDGQMARTRHRPVVKGRVTQVKAAFFAFLIGIIGFVLLLEYANLLTAILTLFALVGYAVVYTLFLKRATPQNIVIGGLAGAMPPLLGWVSETGQLAAEPWLLVMIIFTWTPPHFWALAIHRRDDYARAKIPMLPVTHGINFCKTCILLYSILLAIVCLIPYLIGMSQELYLGVVCVLNGLFIYKASMLKFRPKVNSAMDLFKYSIWQLMILFIGLFIDKWLF